MKKLELYVRIIFLALLLSGCKGQENESKKESIGITVKESIANVLLEDEKENPFIISIPDILYEEESEVSSNEVAEINESASVSDSYFVITLGMLFRDFHYDEEEIPSDVVVNNHGGTEFVDGRAHEWYFHTYTDLTINTSDYIPVMNDMPGENIYIITIVLKSPRFCTSKGIRVGATIDELKEVYGSENLELLEEDVPERIRYRYVDGSVQTDFYIKEEQVRKIALHY